ncbi:MAG: molybdopterin-dependent oxidoreductase [Magnetovibrionaceae bacterium]
MAKSGLVRTTCPYCGVGCGVLIEPAADGGISVKGDPDHPANFGRLCSKGTHLGETVGPEGRLLTPSIAGETVEWDTAIQTVASKFSSLIAEHGPDSVAFYLSGQLLTEDYYVANKLMKGFIGTSNVDTNSRLCMSSAVAGYKRAFGSDTVPVCYEDLELADLVVLVGSNLAWCHPVLFQRLKKAREERGTTVVVIDPRRTATCEIADLHLQIKPGTDVALFNGLLHHLSDSDCIDSDFVEASTEGLEAALASAAQGPKGAPEVAETCGLAVSDVAGFFALVEATEKTLTAYSQGINQSSQGTDKANAILNTHLLTGRIGKPGMGPFSVTGQPNAMGGREVGGLANMLAAHMDFDEASIDRVGRFWQASNMVAGPGLKAVDLFEAVADGRIKAVWVMATNPAVSLPDAERVRDALKTCEFVVVSDVVEKTDTLDFADVALPAAAWGEKSGTVTNSERRISRQKPFMDLPGQAKPDWWIICEVAKAMGFEKAFEFADAAEIFEEHAQLSVFENDGKRDFDLGGLTGLSKEAYDDLQPVQWPLPLGEAQGEPRLFGDGCFFTPSQRARFVPVAAKNPAHPVSLKRPLVLNSGRLRDQWHTMTRTGLSPTLNAHRVEPSLDVHPDDAAEFGLQDDGYVQVETDWGQALVRVRFEPGQRRGEVFLPMHWSKAFSARAGVGPLVNPATDPVSGQPESKHTPCSVKAWVPAYQGLVMMIDPPRDPEGAAYWCRAARRGAHFMSLAGQEMPDDPEAFAMALCDGPGEWIHYADPAGGDWRLARTDGDRLLAVVYLAKGSQMPSAGWLESLFGLEAFHDDARLSVLAGRAHADLPDQGRIVCSCFSVGINTIVDAILDQKLTSVSEISAALRAGTNCGSCLPELKEVLHDTISTDVSSSRTAA